MACILFWEINFLSCLPKTKKFSYTKKKIVTTSWNVVWNHQYLYKETLWHLEDHVDLPYRVRRNYGNGLFTKYLINELRITASSKWPLKERFRRIFYYDHQYIEIYPSIYYGRQRRRQDRCFEGVISLLFQKRPETFEWSLGSSTGPALNDRRDRNMWIILDHIYIDLETHS